MGSSGGGSSGGDTTTTIRYAGYIESSHKTFLSNIANSVATANATSPYSTFKAIDPSNGFLGIGLTINSYASLFKNFSSYMLDVNPTSLYNTVLGSIVNSQEVKDSIASEGRLLSEDIVNDAYPRLMVGARDLNSVMSSTFIISKSNIENQRLRLLGKYSADLKLGLLGNVSGIWKTVLDWNIQVVNNHRQNLTTYYDMLKTTEDFNYTMYAKNKLWPFNAYDYQRAALGALQGATTTKQVAGESSSGPEVLGGVMGGAAMGGMVTAGNPIGMVVGGIIGGIASIF